MAGVMYTVIGLGVVYWLFFMGGKDKVAGIIGEFTGGSGLGDIFKSKTSGTGESTTDEKGNNTNVDSDVNSESNVSLDGKSDQNISQSKQTDTTGDAKQTQSSTQKSSKGRKSSKKSNYTNSFMNPRESFFTKYGQPL
jgi:hypothetical protein